MKRILVIMMALVLALSMGLVPALAAEEPPPSASCVKLLADQDVEVGNVCVWNDEDNLYVQYALNEAATDEGWEIVKTHLYVGKNEPPTSAPGQFPYDDDDASGVPATEVLYVIPLAGIDSYSMQLNRRGKQTGVMIADGDPGVEPCNDIYIAAHAVVEKCETEPRTLCPELIWQRSSEESVAVFPGYGAQWTKEEGFAIGLDPEAIVWDGGEVGQYFTGYSTRDDISWASWVCTENPNGKSLTGTDLRRFQATFDIPAGYSVTGGTLGSVNPGYETVIPMNDNIYIFVNEELVFWGGTISLAGLDPARTHFLGVERRDTEPQNKAAFPETDGWHMDGAIPTISSSLFGEGANVLDVFAEEFWTGGGMHELGLTLEGEQTTCETETAWGEGEPFGTNWAMYFEYHVQPVPCMTPSGSMSVTGTGWVNDTSPATAWCPCAYTYDLTATGEPIALQGFVDTSGAALANPGDWSKYFAKFSIHDSSNRIVNVVFANSWLGTWYEIPPHAWDRISLETENVAGFASNTPHAQQWYATEGGVLGYDMDGNWVGAGNGATVYPSDQLYFFQLIADSDANTFTLQVYAMGSSAPANPPDGWPKQNMYDHPTWLELGTITVTEFDFTEVSICAVLWASTQAGEEDTSTISWIDMQVGAPLTFDDSPGE
jgi:hypothetical protein